LTGLFFGLSLELDTTGFNEGIVCNMLENLLLPVNLLMLINGGRVSQQQLIFNDLNIQMPSETHFSRQQQVLCNATAGEKVPGPLLSPSALDFMPILSARVIRENHTRQTNIKNPIEIIIK
jgi:hypothetical protein